MVRVVVKGRSKLSGVTTMATIGVRTLNEACANFPSARTVMSEVPPAPTAVTMPVLGSIVATVGLFDSHANGRGPRTAPAASFSVTTHELYVWPTSTESTFGCRSMLAIGASSASVVHDVATARTIVRQAAP